MRDRRTWALALVLVGFASSSCVTTDQYNRAMDEKESEIKALREERTRLKGELQQYVGELDEMNVKLQEANARVQSAPTARPVAAGLESQPGLAERGIGYERRDGRVVITIPSSISFASGSAELSKDGKAALKEVARVLERSHPRGRYHIEGHTDSDPIRKSKFGSNRELSIARAMAVLTYLVEDCRIPDDRCVVVGAGQYLPLDRGSSDSAKAKNRRVEIVVHDPS
jgi:chemotaxis protein MotB